MYKQEAIKELATNLVNYGYDVYIAKSGTYGFYTDGKKVISFSYQFGIKVSGNYISTKPSQCGTGWIIIDNLTTITQEQAKQFIEMIAPNWAINNYEFRYTTPNEIIKNYSSSEFKKV